MVISALCCLRCCDVASDTVEETTETQTLEVAEAEEEPAARPRSESWLAKFGKSVANTAKKIGKDIGDGTKKLGKQIGDGTKKAFAKKNKDAAPQDGDAGAEEAAPAPASNKKPKFPEVGSACATPYGPAVIVSITDGRAVVDLNWSLADGHNARAYLSATLLKKPVPKFIEGAGKVMHKVGNAIAGNNGIFGKNTWAKVGDAIKTTADKATHGMKEAFKKKPQAAAEEEGAAEEGEAVEEGENPYAASASAE